MSDSRNPAPANTPPLDLDKSLGEVTEKLRLFRSVEYPNSRTPVDVTLDKFRIPGHEKSLSEALVRAAYSGTLFEIMTLIENGADINHRTPFMINPPLHNAIQGGIVLNVALLLELGAKQYLVNQTYHTARELGLASENPLISYLFNDWSRPKTISFNTQQHPALSNSNILQMIFSYLNSDDLSKVRRVSVFWNRSATHYITSTLKKYNTTPEQISQFYHLSKELQFLIYKFAVKHKSLDQIPQLLTVLALKPAERMKQLFPLDTKIQQQCSHFGDYATNSIASDIGILFYVLKVLTKPQIEELDTYICNFSGAIALLEDLLTLDQINAIKNAAKGPSTLTDLISPRGICALREKLITPQQAISLRSSIFNNAYCPDVLKALRNKLITIDQIISLDDALGALLYNDELKDPYGRKTYGGYRLLEMGLIKIDVVMKLPFHCQSDLLKPNGLTIIAEGLATLEQLIKTNCIGFIISEPGVTILRERLLTIDQLNDVIETRIKNFGSNSSISHLISTSTVAALRSGQVSIHALKSTQNLYALIPTVPGSQYSFCDQPAMYPHRIFP